VSRFWPTARLRRLLALLLIVSLAGCSRVATSPPAIQGEPAPEQLPALEPAALAAGERLSVLATTSLIGDVAAQIGGDHVQVTTLLPIDADPHTYTATPQDRRTLEAAQVILINGLGLEEPLMPVLSTLDSGAPVVSVNVGVKTLGVNGETGQDAADGHAADPHTWFDVANVKVWAANIQTVLSALDPAHAADYAAHAAAYATTLDALDQEIRAQVATLPPDRRKLVTDHDELAYFAAAYDFEVIGTVIPAISTLAQPSAQELVALQEQIKAAGVPAIFAGTTVNPDLERQLARDLGIKLVTLYTASLSAADGPAPTYVELMRYTVRTIVAALAP
jgi:ABC-type Zn uptake system ZnuABC Zn-binding protein ZnuA